MQGITIKYSGGSWLDEQGFAHSTELTIHVVCADSDLPSAFNYTGGYSDLSYAPPVIKTYSGWGCPVFQKNAFQIFLDNYWIELDVFAMLLGIVLCFFGRVMIKPALFVIGFCSSTFGLSLLYFLLFYKETTPHWILWGIGFLGALIGIILGLVLY